MERACLFSQRWSCYTRPHGLTTHRTKIWLYWGYVPTFPLQDASNWNFVKFSGAWCMDQKVIFSKRNYLPRYSALPHSYDSSGDSSQLFIVQFLGEISQGLPQRKSRVSCDFGASLHSPTLARVIRQWTLLLRTSDWMNTRAAPAYLASRIAVPELLLTGRTWHR
jgi:hypothetical protein